MNGFVNTGALYLLLFTLISTAPPTFLNHLHNRQILCHLVRHFLLQTYGGLASFVTHFFFGSRGVPFHLSMCFAFTRRVGGLRGTFATCFRVAANPFSRLCGTWCPVAAVWPPELYVPYVTPGTAALARPGWGQEVAGAGGHQRIWRTCRLCLVGSSS